MAKTPKKHEAATEGGDPPDSPEWRRANEAIKRALSTPPKSQAELMAERKAKATKR